MRGTEGSGRLPSLSSSPSPSPPPPRSRSRFQQSSPSSSRRRQRSWSPRSPSMSPPGGRRSRSRSWSPIASSSAAAAAAEEEAKALCIFFSYAVGPIAYCLYIFKLPNPILPLPPLQPCDQFRETENTIYPILEFRSGEYQKMMCCVGLESKLYFLGGGGITSKELLSRPEGNDWENRDPYPPDVYVLDTAAIFPNTTAVTTNDPSQLLRKGTPMNTGKPNPYVFVAYRKIYIIAIYIPFSGDTISKISRFEVFDPDSDNWSSLPDPPMNVRVTVSHALVDRDVYILTLNKRILSYNLDKCKWVQRGEIRENTFYTICYDNLAAFGPNSEPNPEAKAKGLSKALRSLDVDNAVKDHLPAIDALSYLVHLGNSIFCCALTGGFPHPDPNHICSADNEKIDVSILTLEVRIETHTESASEREKTFSPAKLLHTARYVARSKCGAMANCFRRGCFSISTNSAKHARLNRKHEDAI